MRSRLFAFVVILAGIWLQPRHVDASQYGFDYSQPIYGGALREDSTCPGATHALFDYCHMQKTTYLVFNHMKGVKHRLNTGVLLQGPVDRTTCPLPLVDVRHIGQDRFPPPPCG
jgi:hypothetical protein